MAKIISAQSILKQKGYVQNKFDTNGFMQAVANYFIENGVDDKLLLVSFRFLDKDKMEWVSHKDYTFELNPFDINDDDIKLGYKLQYACDERNRMIYAVNLREEERDRQFNDGILVPRIIVDEPYFENAVATLKLMCGYVCEKWRKRRRKLCWVKLV